MTVQDALISLQLCNPDSKILIASNNPWNDFREMADFIPDNLDIMESQVLVFNKKYNWVLIDYGLIRPNQTLKMSLVIKLEPKDGSEKELTQIPQNQAILDIMKG